jgi:hypothetical protein
MGPQHRGRGATLAACVLAVAACGGAGSGPGPAPVPSPSRAAQVADPTVAAAGDISPPRTAAQAETARLVLRLDPTRVLAVGDLQYPRGELDDFRRYYDKTWGRFKARTRPVPGNHEYMTPGAQGYVAYWGALARPDGRSYYSFDLGGWHLVALDSNIARNAGSAQARWLRQDLAATSKRCVLAYWHRPRFSSGSRHGGDTTVGTFWAELYGRRADVVLGGHEHHYERFGPQTAVGAASAGGIRQFVVGTGGNGRYPFGAAKPHSEKRITGSYGVLHLTLRPKSYSWRFVDVAGKVLDSGGPVTCH